MSAAPPSRPEALHRHPWLVQLVAGERRWGWLDVWPTRYGYTRFRLVVCPPGTSTTERAVLRLWRAWPTAALVTGFLLVVTSVLVGVPPELEMVVAVVGVVVVLITLARATRRQRPLTRVRLGGAETGRGARASFGDIDVIERCWYRLVIADEALAQGEINALEHETVWAWVWNDLGTTPVASRRS